MLSVVTSKKITYFKNISAPLPTKKSKKKQHGALEKKLKKVGQSTRNCEKYAVYCHKKLPGAGGL